MISSNTTAFGQDSSFLCGTALLQRIWHFGSKMFSFGKLCLEFEKCFINLARTFLSSHYKNGHYSDLLQPKRMLQCSKKRLIIFWKKKIRHLFLCQEGYFNCLILLSYQIIISAFSQEQIWDYTQKNLAKLICPACTQWKYESTFSQISLLVIICIRIDSSKKEVKIWPPCYVIHT